MSEIVSVYNNSKNPWQVGNIICLPGVLTPVDKPSWDAFKENHVGKSIVRDKLLMEGKPEVLSKAKVPSRADVFATMTAADVPNEIKRQILKEGKAPEKAVKESENYSELDLDAMDKNRLLDIAKGLDLDVDGRNSEETLREAILDAQED